MLQSMSSPWSREESDRQDLVTEQPPPLSSSTGNKAPNQVEDGNSRLSKSPGTLSSYLTTNQSEESLHTVEGIVLSSSQIVNCD